MWVIELPNQANGRVAAYQMITTRNSLEIAFFSVAIWVVHSYVNRKLVRAWKVLKVTYRVLYCCGTQYA